MKSNPKLTARAAALDSLLRCERDGRWSNLEIDAAIKKYRLEGAERGLYTTLVYGVTESRITLDYFISRLSSKPIDSLDAEILTILRLGLYQLIKLDRVPDSAAVNESVVLAKAMKPHAAPFVNALLRNFIRTVDRSALPYPSREDARYLSVRYSCEQDVIDVLGDDAEAILEAFSRQPDVTLRVNTLKLSRDALLARLCESGVDAQPTERSPFGIRLQNHANTDLISGLISSGEVYIQDEASQLSTLAAGIQPGTTVIDACACPGGKSFSAAMLMENRGRVLAFDLHANKLSLVRNGAEKLGISVIETAPKNGSVFDAALEKCADTVICDAPCSGLGVIGKKPELRYKKADEFARLPEVQYAILSNCAHYAKVGGVVIYSTCTLNKDENESVARRFVAENPDFAPEEFTLAELESKDGMLTLYPHLHSTDGFFISKFRRKS